MTTKKIITQKQILSQHQKNTIALFLALLFHICGAIGILVTPYKQWFINNTPVNLLLMTTLLIFTQKQKNFFFYAFVLLCFFTGIITEMIGVNTGALFGHYTYGAVLGAKLFNVPILIGVNWFIAIFCSCNIIFLLNEWLYKKIPDDIQPSLVVKLSAFVIDAAMLTTLFDYILEPTAMQLGFWRWLPNGSVPVFNFVCWFIISAVLATFFRLMNFDKHNQFAIHLLIIQLLFFLVLQTFL